MNLDHAKSMDACDLFSNYRQEFYINDDEIYLCGHSLGAMPKNMSTHFTQILREEWGAQKVSAWNNSNWINLPQTLGAQFAHLLGVEEDEVIFTDSISVNLFKLLVAALRLQPNKKIILTEIDNFPADLYIAQGIAELFPDVKIKMCTRHEIMEQLNDETAVLMLTHVNYRTSEVYPLAELTEYAHQQGALVLFDLAHSAGIVPLQLNQCKVDMAVGCSYKYLHGGPGSPAFLFISKRHHEKMHTPLTGWMGHRAMFEFKSEYEPAAGMTQFLCGTAPILSMRALSLSLGLFQEVSMIDVNRKSQQLTEYFISLVTEFCPQLKLISPQLSTKRGGHVAYQYSEAYALKLALLEAGIICDYRMPDTLRFGPSPLHTRFVDIFKTVKVLTNILEKKLHQTFLNKTKQKVT